jgi:hypothetical protein
MLYWNIINFFFHICATETTDCKNNAFSLALIKCDVKFFSIPICIADKFWFFFMYSWLMHFFFGGELIGVLLENVNGRPISGVSCYSATSWDLNSYRVVEADMWALVHPIIVCGDFDTHSQSCGCESDAVGASMLRFAHSNSGASE